MTEAFTREERLRKKKDIEYLLRNGKRISDEYLTIYYEDSDRLVVGIGIKKGLKGAVKRNLLRRRLKGIMRKEKKNLRTDVKFLLLSRPQTVNLLYRELEKRVISLFSKAELLKY